MTATQLGLTVFQVDAENNLLLVKGAIPGANGDVVLVRAGKKAKKAPKAAA